MSFLVPDARSLTRPANVSVIALPVLRSLVLTGMNREIAPV
jgi:hypothetical protein